MTDRLQYLMLRRKDIIESFNISDLPEAERAEYSEALEQINKDIAEERIKILQGSKVSKVAVSS